MSGPRRSAFLGGGRRQRARTLVLSAGLLLAACAGGEEGPPRAGQDAPSYRAATLDGGELSLAELEGSPVLLNFWATWCTPCRQETPFLQSIHERYRGQDLRVVGVSMDSPGTTGEIRTFAKRYGVTYTILHDAGSRGMDVFSIMGLPATYILDAEGTIRFVRIGPVSEQDRAFHEVLEGVTGS